jgi:single-stranded-DNA-specific exonuclease
MGKGSARSISGFHIYNGISKLEALLIEFGGHKYAAGLVIEADKIDEFTERFEEVVTDMTTEDHFIPTLKIDAEITLSDIKKYNLMHETKLLSPFGSTNPEPVFLARGLVINEMRLVGKNHLKLAFKDNNHRWNAIAFGKGEMASSGMDVVDVAFNLRENKWGGNSSTELNIRDLKAV